MKPIRTLAASLLLAALPLAAASDPLAAIPEKDRDWPLHYLLRTKQYDAVLDLLPLAADLNAFDREGRTLLTIAARDKTADAYDMVKALLERGADPKLQDERGTRPLTTPPERGRWPWSSFSQTATERMSTASQSTRKPESPGISRLRSGQPRRAAI